MIKKFIILAAIVLLAGPAGAKVTNIADWDGGITARNSEPPVTSCAQACAGYDLTTLICPSGQKLESCTATGCSYYHRCVQE